MLNDIKLTEHQQSLLDGTAPTDIDDDTLSTNDNENTVIGTIASANTIGTIVSSPSVSTKSLQVQPLAPAVIKGYKFFNSVTGENILVKGIDYYPRPNHGKLNLNNVDLFTEEYRHIWERDIKVFVDLGINALRLYSVDPDMDHSAFMCALHNAGIYVVVSLASGSASGSCKGSKCAITSDAAPHCYPPTLKVRGEMIIREFSRYDNTLAFSAGNEVNHYTQMHRPQWNAPCLKKFVRDMRAFVHGCSSSEGHNGDTDAHDHGMRKVPIGLIMADTDRDENTMYYNCQGDPNDELENAEWYGINTYVYCNGTATQFNDALGFQELLTSFESYNYSIPSLLTEFGCLSETFPDKHGYEGQRTFRQAEWLDLPQVQDNFAGGMVFEYVSEAANAGGYPFHKFGQANYGIGHFSPELCDDVTVMCKFNPAPSFSNLKRAYSIAHALNVTMEEFEPELHRTGRSECPKDFPPLNSFHWKADWKPSIRCHPRSESAPFMCPSPNGNVGVVTDTKNVFSPGAQSPSSSSPPVTEHSPFSCISLTIVAMLIGLSFLLVTFIPILRNRLDEHRKYDCAATNRKRMGDDETIGLMSSNSSNSSSSVEGAYSSMQLII